MMILGRIFWGLVLCLLAGPVCAQEARSVERVFWDARGDSLVVETNAELQPTVTRLESPLRCVIDLPNTRMSRPHISLPGSVRHGVTRVRVGHVSASTVRVVLDLARGIEPQIEQGEGRLVIGLVPSVRAPVLSAPRPQSTIQGIRLQGRSFLVAMTPRRPYWSHVWPVSAQKTRLSLVFPQTTLAPGVYGTVAIQANGVERVVASQRGPDARIDFDCTRAPQFDIVPHTKGWLLVAAPESQAPAGVEKTSRPVGEPATAPSAAPLTLRQAGDEWLLTLSADERVQYKVTSAGDDRLYLEISGASLSLPRDSVYIDNGLIARVRTQTKGAKQTRLTIDFDQAVRHRSRLLASERSVELSLRRSGKSRVTLDPGHGGTDTGTTGRAGTREKDVTLAVASRLARNLERNGVSVQMTRMRDLEILLRPRVEMANRNESEVFISIHANSFGNNQSVNGIETYYFNDASYPLARAIHQSLVRSLKRPDRGVRKNNFYVVNHTKMPAALVEIGYLSNPEEETLLKDPAYQEKAAQAIYDGVQEFMKGRRNVH